MLKREGVMRTDGMVTKHEFLRMMEKRFDALDQCWDLLRQRRALREFGDDPSRARVRDADVVKKYIG